MTLEEAKQRMGSVVLKLDSRIAAAVDARPTVAIPFRAGSGEVRDAAIGSWRRDNSAVKDCSAHSSCPGDAGHTEVSGW